MSEMLHMQWEVTVEINYPIEPTAGAQYAENTNIGRLNQLPSKDILASNLKSIPHSLLEASPQQQK